MRRSGPVTPEELQSEISEIQRLFNGLDQYIETIGDGSVDLDDDDREIDDAPVLFCQAFFQRYLELEFNHEVHVPDDDDKRWAVGRRLRLTGEHAEATGGLLVAFEELCDLAKDIQQASYAESPPGFIREFHGEYLVSLLDRIAVWADSRGNGGIVERAHKSLDALEAVL
jgi:hypothetical protein